MENQDLSFGPPSSALWDAALRLGRLVPESALTCPERTGPLFEGEAILTLERAVALHAESIRGLTSGAAVDLIFKDGILGVFVCALAVELGSRCILQMDGTDSREIGRPPGALFSPFRTADIYFGDGWVPAGIYRREEIPRGAGMSGPSIICRAGLSLVVDPGWEARTGMSGDILLTRE